MSKYNYAPGAIHIDNHKDLTLNVPPGTNPADLIRAFLSDNAEDIPSSPASDNRPKDDFSSVSPESNSGSDYFPFLTKKCFDENLVEAVETEIQAARKGTAEDMWRTLWNNENMGYIEVQYIDASTLYREIEKHYGKLPYTERNFRGARNKR